MVLKQYDLRGDLSMNMKKSHLLLIFIAIIMALAYGCYGYFSKTKTILPLKDIVSIEDASNWRIYVLNDAQDKILLDVYDPILLYDNRELFSIQNDNDVYKTTPQYVVKILRNDKVYGLYYLIDIDQIDFGTIPYENR